MTARLSPPQFAIILHTSNRRKDGTFPVCLRITHFGRRKYYVLGPSCRQDQWNHEAGRYIRNQDENIRLNAFELRAKKILTEFEESEKQFSFDRFETAFFVNTNLKRVFIFLEDEIRKLKEADRAGSRALLITLKNSLDLFRKGKDFSFVDIDLAFLQKYEAFLSKTCAPNGIAVYMRHLRAIYNKAMDLGLVKRENYPFNKYKIKTEITRKRALTKQQIELLINYPVEEGTRKFHSRNYFAFSYLTRGMNFVDLSRLRFENIIDDRIVYIRSKTKTSRSRGDGRAFNIPIRGLVREMINYYRKNHFTGAGYIFPILGKKYESNIQEKYAIARKSKLTNKDIQDICEDLKIPAFEGITFYSARHSWATLAKKQGTSTEMIQEAMGHGNIKTTEIYLGQFDSEQLDQADKHLEEFKIFSIKK